MYHELSVAYKRQYEVLSGIALKQKYLINLKLSICCDIKGADLYVHTFISFLAMKRYTRLSRHPLYGEECFVANIGVNNIQIYRA